MTPERIVELREKNELRFFQKDGTIQVLRWNDDLSECLDEIERLREMVVHAMPFVLICTIKEHAYTNDGGKANAQKWLKQVREMLQ